MEMVEWNREFLKGKYLEGVRAIGGASKYYECGELAKRGPAIKVAECLMAAKKKITEDKWAEKWAKAMFG